MGTEHKYLGTSDQSEQVRLIYTNIFFDSVMSSLS